MTVVDDEGFPVGPAFRDRRRAHPEKDEENGEVVREKMVAFRRLPDHRPLPYRHSCCSKDLLHTPFPLMKHHQRLGRFRIQDVIQGHGDLKFRGGSLLYRREVQGLLNPRFETCLYLEGGVPVRRVINFSKVIVPDGAYGRKQIFRVPKESLPPDQSEEPSKCPETICVSIWEEFLYGKSVLNRCSKAGGKVSGASDTLYNFLGRYLSTSVIDILMYTLFFVLYFASCCVYNMFWELGSYILFASHLQIHERAYENKLDVEFTGSSFQGPAYVFIRNWCAHCVQRDREKIMFRLMKKMKVDIISSKNR